MLVREIFPTIQGEGPRAGTPAVFVRLGGCPLRCTWCDTDFREEASIEMEPPAVVQLVQCAVDRQPSSLVVITGGEPMAQPLLPLVKALEDGLLCPDIQIETSGIIHQRIPYLVDVVISPKTPTINYEGRVAAWKYIIRAGEVADDGLPIYATQGMWYDNKLLARPSFNAPIYVQPCDEHDPEKNAANLAATLDVVKRFGYRLSLQQHKIIDWE
jgi:7-carboxy-7-deazaguanine synthase